MNELPLRLKRTDEFLHWYESLDIALRGRIDISFDYLRAGHFGDSKSLADGLFELRWKIGMRVYFSRKRIGGIDVIVLLGGFKGKQHADIEKARRLKEIYEHALEKDAREGE